MMNRFPVGWLVALVAAGVAIAAVFIYRGSPRSDPSELSPPVSATPAAATTSARAQAHPDSSLPSSLPAGHPPPTDSGLPAAAGQVANVDHSAHFTHFRVGQHNVKTILPDGDLMWVGTTAGVIRYDTAADDYRLLDTRTGLLANGVFHLSRIQGQLAVGTYGGGLSILNEQDETWKTYNIPDGLGDGFIYDVIELDNGDVWIATWSGANRVRGGRLDDRESWDLFTVENTAGGLPNDWVYGLHAGADGTVWLATEGGLTHFDNGRWQNWQHEDGLGTAYEQVRGQIEFGTDPAEYSKHHARQKVEMGLESVDIAYNPNYIVSLAVDSHGVVWCGTWGGGLARFDGREWRNYSVTDGLPGNHVFMLHVDPDGTLWVGTNNGLARMSGDTFTRFSTADGLFSNRVFSMATASDNSRWIGSFGGVARVVSFSGSAAAMEQ